MTWMSAMLSSDRTSVVQSHPPRLRSRNAMFDCSHVVTTQSYDSTVKLNKSECDLILFKKPLLMCGWLHSDVIYSIACSKEKTSRWSNYLTLGSSAFETQVGKCHAHDVERYIEQSSYLVNKTDTSESLKSVTLSQWGKKRHKSGMLARKGEESKDISLQETITVLEAGAWSLKPVDESREQCSCSAGLRKQGWLTSTQLSKSSRSGKPRTTGCSRLPWESSPRVTSNFLHAGVRRSELSYSRGGSNTHGG